MIEEATFDAYGHSEQITGTMLEEHLALPFETTVLDVVVRVVARSTFVASTASSPSARAVASESLSPSLICRFPRVDRGVPSLDRWLTTRSDGYLEAGVNRRPRVASGTARSSVYHHERRLKLRQICDQEVT